MSRLAFLFALFLSALPAGAHPLDLALLNATAESDAIAVRLEVNPVVLAGRGESAAVTELLKSARASLGGRPCAWTEGGSLSRVSDSVVALEAKLHCPAGTGRLALDLPFIEKREKSFQVIGTFRAQGSEELSRATPDRPSLDFEWKAQPPSLLEFVHMGIAHIGATPGEWKDDNGFHLPDGIDHILFVVALLLSGGGVLSLLKTVTGFTIGHSVTLGLATAGILRLPPRIVESGIALSIAIVALESVLIRGSKSRWKLALGFGLLHGLGFAAALTDLHLSSANLLRALLGFNVGVEAGQALIIVALTPILLALGRFPRAQLHAVRACALCIFLLGSYWFVQRAFM